MKYLKQIVFCIAIACATIVLQTSFFAPNNDNYAEAQQVDCPLNQLCGWAWSDNIGWISFNSSDVPGTTIPYAVTMGSETCISNCSGGLTPFKIRYLSGYAWSDTIGWIKFGSDVIPGSNFGAYIVTSHSIASEIGKVNDYARACAVYETGCSGLYADTGTGTSTVTASDELGGWDGLIRFNGHSNVVVRYSTTTGMFSGAAWGDQVIGWIDMSKVRGYYNRAPAVSLTSPTQGQTFTTGSNIPLEASVTDDGTISRVNFYNGTNLVGADISAPYRGTISGAANGTYNLTAEAIDNNGLTGTSSVVTVTVNAPLTQCNDGSDNDGDEYTDTAEDPNCSDPDNIPQTEDYGGNPECSDGINNDADITNSRDWSGNPRESGSRPADPECGNNPKGQTESMLIGETDVELFVGLDGVTPSLETLYVASSTDVAFKLRYKTGPVATACSINSYPGVNNLNNLSVATTTSHVIMDPVFNITNGKSQTIVLTCTAPESDPQADRVYIQMSDVDEH